MTSSKLMLFTLAAAFFLFAQAAHSSAQDRPTMTVSPSHVESPGEYTFKVTSEGWTASPPLGVLACPDLVDQTDCDRANGVTVNELQDGGFTTEIVVQVPSEGIYIGAGDYAETQAVAVRVTVGGEADLPATGLNTSLLVIMGTGIVLAGVMVFGLSRRLPIL